MIHFFVRTIILNIRRRIAEEKARKDAEEKARIEAERQAKRKAQDEANRAMLAQMEAEWKAKQNNAQQATAQPIVAQPSQTAICPNCGTPVAATAKFCTGCGARLMVQCPNCKEWLKANAKFCHKCGTKQN